MFPPLATYPSLVTVIARVLVAAPSCPRGVRVYQWPDKRVGEGGTAWTVGINKPWFWVRTDTVSDHGTPRVREGGIQYSLDGLSWQQPATDAEVFAELVRLVPSAG